MSFLPRSSALPQLRSGGGAGTPGPLGLRPAPALFPNPCPVGFACEVGRRSSAQDPASAGFATDTSLVLGGTNDLSGAFFDPEANFTGWQLSTDSGASLRKDGLLPPVTEGGTDTRPSGGDPVDRFDQAGQCNLYAATVN